MSDFIVDNSVVLAWAFADEAEEYPVEVLKALESNTALVPAIWLLELTNVLAVAERRSRITESESLRFLTLLSELPIDAVQDSKDINTARQLLFIARDFNLSAYDACYLDLAIERNLPLATLDSKLRRAAKKAGIAIWTNQ
jgi:predicted nucleic acid-binding protein